MFLLIGRLFTTEHAPNTHHFINTVSAPHNLRAFHGAVSRDIKLLKAHLPLGIFVKCFEDRMVVIFFCSFVLYLFVLLFQRGFATRLYHWKFIWFLSFFHSFGFLWKNFIGVFRTLSNIYDVSFFCDKKFRIIIENPG